MYCLEMPKSSKLNILKNLVFKMRSILQMKKSLLKLIFATIMKLNFYLWFCNSVFLITAIAYSHKYFIDTEQFHISLQNKVINQSNLRSYHVTVYIHNIYLILKMLFLLIIINFIDNCKHTYTHVR